MAKAYIGLDLGSAQMKLAEVRRAGRGFMTTQIAVADTPRHGIQKSIILDEEVVTASLRAMLDKVELNTDRVALGITNSQVVLKTVKMPLMTIKELQQAIEFELEDIMGFPFTSRKEVVYSFDVLTKTEQEQTVFVVACRRSLIDPYLSVARRCKLEPAVIDLHSFSLPRLLPDKDRVCVVDIGAQQTSVYVQDDGQYKVYRILPIGGHHITEGIMEAFACDQTEAELLKRTKDMDYLLLEGPGSRRMIRLVIQQLANGILQTLDFLRAEARLTNIADALSELYLCGGTSCMSGLAELLSDEVGVAVRVIDPFEQCTLRPGLQILADSGPSIAPALGLAMRGLEER